MKLNGCTRVHNNRYRVIILPPHFRWTTLNSSDGSKGRRIFGQTPEPDLGVIGLRETHTHTIKIIFSLVDVIKLNLIINLEMSFFTGVFNHKHYSDDAPNSQVKRNNTNVGTTTYGPYKGAATRLTKYVVR